MLILNSQKIENFSIEGTNKQIRLISSNIDEILVMRYTYAANALYKHSKLFPIFQNFDFLTENEQSTEIHLRAEKRAGKIKLFPNTIKLGCYYNFEFNNEFLTLALVTFHLEKNMIKDIVFQIPVENTKLDIIESGVFSNQLQHFHLAFAGEILKVKTPIWFKEFTR